MNFKENKAIYLQIADYFCEKILTKEWKSGDRIPSIREISSMLEVNPNTAMRAYTFLQEMRVIYNQRGIGYFVSEDGYKKALNLKRDEFMEDDLPELFKSMDLLGIGLEDLKDIYQKYHT